MLSCRETRRRWHSEFRSCKGVGGFEAGAPALTTAATSGIFFGFYPPVFFCAAPRLFVGCPPSANNGTGAIGSLKHEDDAEDDDEEEEDDDEEENEGADTVAPPVEPGSLEDRSAPASRPFETARPRTTAGSYCACSPGLRQAFPMNLSSSVFWPGSIVFAEAFFFPSSTFTFTASALTFHSAACFFGGWASQI